MSEQSMSLETLRRGPRAVGAKQVMKALRRGDVRLVCLAKDADAFVTAPVRELAMSLKVEVIETETMEKLGQACGIEVRAAAAAALGQPK